MPRFVQFVNQYVAECLNVGQSPLKWLTASHSTELVLDVDRVSSSAWPPLVKALSCSTDLTKLCVFSSSGIQNGSSVHVRMLIEAVADCVAKSPQLSDLDFIQLDLGHSFLLRLIATGISKNLWLRHLSFENCAVDDEGVEKICSTLKNHPSVTHVCFSGRKITKATPFVSLINHQQLVRSNAGERRECRDSPKPSKFRGLSRLSLVDCPNLKTPGFRMIADSLMDNERFKALDMINCGIDKRGLSTLDALLSSNKSLVVLDLRGNPILSCAGDLIRQKLLILSQGTQKYPILSSNHTWDPPRKASPPKGKQRSPQVAVDKVLTGKGENPLDALLKSLVEEREARKRAEREVIELRMQNSELKARVSRLEYLNGFTENTAVTVEDTLLRFQSFLDALQDLRLECEVETRDDGLDSVPVREKSDDSDKAGKNNSAEDDYNEETFESDSSS